jgi:hypothetical protein
MDGLAHGRRLGDPPTQPRMLTPGPRGGNATDSQGSRSKDRSRTTVPHCPILAGSRREPSVRHCPECQHTYDGPVDVCPECWVNLAPGAPRPGHALSLVCETAAVFEADLLEALLWDEGIPCVRVARAHALPPPFATAQGQRVYVRADMAATASEIAIALLGRSEDRQ